MQSPNGALFLSEMKQEYDRYTDDDQKVWRILFDRQWENLQSKACRAYLEGVRDIGFTREKIPNFSEVDKRLMNRHGWSIQVVPGIIPAVNFFALLGDKKFCSSTWLRSKDSLDYLEEPDMFHDSFGHLPMLMNRDFSAFATQLAEMATKYPSEKNILRLQRIYWFTIEFGLVREDGDLKAYGAGICSSSGETNYSLSGKPEYLDFDIKQIMDTEFYTDHIQDKYFVLPDISELNGSLKSVENILRGE